MANVFLALPVPAGNETGAAVDTSSLGRSRSVAVVGAFQANIFIEVSEDGVTFGPLATFTSPDVETFDVAARWMRVRVAGWEAGPLPVVSVGSDDIGTLFAALPVPAGNGVGASVDISTLGLFKTIVVAGPFQASVGVEVSEDGANYVPLLSFSGPTTQSLMAITQRARVRVASYPGVGPLPTVTIAGVNDATAGGGGGGGAVVNGTYAGSGALAVGDVVYLSAPGTVSQADADDATKQPVIGFVASIVGPVVTVQYGGELAVFVGLTPGATQYLSTTPGQITEIAPVGPPGAIVQRVAFAKNATTIVVQVDRDWIVL